MPKVFFLSFSVFLLFSGLPTKAEVLTPTVIEKPLIIEHEFSFPRISRTLFDTEPFQDLLWSNDLKTAEKLWIKLDKELGQKKDFDLIKLTKIIDKLYDQGFKIESSLLSNLLTPKESAGMINPDWETSKNLFLEEGKEAERFNFYVQNYFLIPSSLLANSVQKSLNKIRKEVFENNYLDIRKELLESPFKGTFSKIYLDLISEKMKDNSFEHLSDLKELGDFKENSDFKTEFLFNAHGNAGASNFNNSSGVEKDSIKGDFQRTVNRQTNSEVAYKFIGEKNETGLKMGVGSKIRGGAQENRTFFWRNATSDYTSHINYNFLGKIIFDQCDDFETCNPFMDLEVETMIPYSIPGNNWRKEKAIGSNFSHSKNLDESQKKMINTLEKAVTYEVKMTRDSSHRGACCYGNHIGTQTVSLNIKNLKINRDKLRCDQISEKSLDLIELMNNKSSLRQSLFDIIDCQKYSLKIKGFSPISMALIDSYFLKLPKNDVLEVKTHEYLDNLLARHFKSKELETKKKEIILLNDDLNKLVKLKRGEVDFSTFEFKKEIKTNLVKPFFKTLNDNNIDDVKTIESLIDSFLNNFLNGQYKVKNIFLDKFRDKK